MTTASRQTAQSPPANAYRWYAPRCWHGMRTGTWLQLLCRNRFAVSPTRWGLACTVSMATVVNSVLAAAQHLALARRIEATRLVDDPIFIIGHWRSGTTLLHELLVQDERFTFPNTYACFAPNHFVISRPLIVPWLRFLLPSLRPMDNMPVAWNRPQEDEFALLAMGLPSPYESLAFPNRIPPGVAHLDHQQWSPTEQQRWQAAMVWFLKCITYQDPRRIVLKSPPHTRRIAMLRDVFPNAQFLHIVRDPCALFASTVRLWKSLAFAQGLQVPKNKRLEEAVLDGLAQMYAILEADKKQLGASEYAEIRYEDLVADPRRALERVYADLNLGAFDAYLPRLDAYWKSVSGYTVTRYHLDAGVRHRIAQRWEPFLTRYGYTV